MLFIWWNCWVIVKNSILRYPLRCAMASDVLMMINSLRPSDAIRRQGTESTLAQVMACCLTAPSHTWTKVDLSSVRSCGCGIHRRALSWEELKISVSKTRSKISFLESHTHLPGANELIGQCYYLVPLFIYWYWVQDFYDNIFMVPITRHLVWCSNGDHMSQEIFL